MTASASSDNGKNTSASKESAYDVTTLELTRMNHLELENYLGPTKHSTVIKICSGLVDHIKHMERKLEEREELLRKNQRQLEHKDKVIREKDGQIRKLEKELEHIVEVDMPERKGKLRFADNLSVSTDHGDVHDAIGLTVRCKYGDSGCSYRLPCMEQHELKECKFRPVRCPSLTCPVKPTFKDVMLHIEEEHDGTRKGRDRVCRNNSSHLVSSYVNIDKEPVFYKTCKMTWVANELMCDGRYFYLECMRLPPEWHLWVYIVGSEREAQMYQTTITLFREEEYGRVRASGFSAQRSYTGPVVPIHMSKEVIAECGFGFMVNDKQIKPLCGSISNHEEQLFGYEVSVYKKQSRTDSQLQ